MGNIQTKLLKKIKSLTLCSITYFSENRVVYKIMWKNMVRPDWLRMTIKYGACGLRDG